MMEFLDVCWDILDENIPVDLTMDNLLAPARIGNRRSKSGVF